MKKHSVSEYSRVLSWLWALLRYVGGRYRQDHCQQQAAALTYTSLFALVPLMTVTYAAFSFFPAAAAVGNRVQNLVFDHFIPRSGSEVQNYLTDFSSQAQELSVLGGALLLLTAYLMLVNVERALNRIWRVPQPEIGLKKLLVYWALLTLGPVLLGLAMVASTYLNSQDWLAWWFGPRLAQLGWLDSGLLPFLPWLCLIIANALLFWAVPNCAVAPKHAMIGGVITASGFVLAKNLFTWLVSHSSFEFIYGAFAAVPLFLLWLNISWMLLLLGAEVVCALAQFRVLGAADRANLNHALYLLHALWRANKTGEGLSELNLRQDLNDQAIPLDQRGWRQLCETLSSARLLVRTLQGDYVLSRDLAQVSVWSLWQLYQSPLPVPTKRPAGQLPAWYHHFGEQLKIWQAQGSQQFAMSLAELFEMAEVAPANLRVDS